MADYVNHIQNTDSLGFVLYSKSLENFKTDLTVANLISPTNIYFIAQDQTLYLDGVYYGLSVEELQRLSNSINGLISIIKEPIQVKEIKTEGPEGQQSSYEYTTIGPALKYLDQQLTALIGEGGQGGSVASQIQTAVQSLDATVYDNYVDEERYTADEASAWNTEHEAEIVAGTQSSKNAGDIKTPIGVQGGAHVGIKIVETDGKITSVDLVEDDIASAAALEGVQGQLVSGIQGVQGQLISGIQGVQGQLDTLTGSDLATIQNAITAIKNELGGEEGGEPRNLVGSLLDALATVLPEKNEDNTYTFTVGSDEYNTIQAAITQLKTLIDNTSNAGVQGIQGVQATIENLDATVRDNYTNEVYYTQEEIDAAQEGDEAYGKTTKDVKTQAGVQSGHVGIKVTEEDGKLTSVNIVESDIASAATVSTLVDQLTWQVM